MIKAFSTILLLTAATVEARQRGYHVLEQELITAEIERYTGNNNINGGRALRGDSDVRGSSEDTSGKGKDKRTKRSKGSSDDSRKGKSGPKSKSGTKKGKGGNIDEEGGGDGGDSSGVVGFQFVSFASCFGST
jgi:hypothetical protein